MKSDILPTLYLVRHAETAWSLTGQHTSLTDLPLTERGKGEARQLRSPLSKFTFAKVLTSPLQRAILTCKLAGFDLNAEAEPNLTEWNYGNYEGLTTGEIHAQNPEWQLFRDGCPRGELPEAVGARADAIIKRVRSIKGDVLLFSSGHFLRVLSARWLGLEPGAGKCFVLNTASISALSYEHNPSQPVIRFWNDTHHQEL